MENTVPQKLAFLKKLQSIDSQLDKIRKVRGDLPEEVQDLEDEIAGYQTRIEKFEAEKQAFNDHINERNNSIKECKGLIAKYEEQQMNVRNNREFEAITKEMELQELEIQIAHKKIKEAEDSIGRKDEQIAATQEILNERTKDLVNKKSELEVITAETEAEEQKLLKDREKSKKNIDARLLRSYERIRGNAVNGLAVVPVSRGACGGCFNMVPPQRQADIREEKKIIVCEHCGRILADVEIEEIVEKPKRTVKRKATAK